MKSTRVLAAALALVLAFVFAPDRVTAHHSWGKYHWSRTGTTLNLTVAKNVDSTWGSIVDAAIDDWHGRSVLQLTQTNGSANPLSCPATLGRIEVCNAEYGTNGWLGIAQIWISSGSHIAQAITKLNDSYFDTPPYNTTAWRRFVACQEVGHDFGLDHQDERFNNVNLGSCMDYTNDPDGSLNGQLSNVMPNAHDTEQLNSIYSHLDGGGGGGGGGGGRGRAGGASGLLPRPAIEHMPDNDPGSWGRLISTNGRLARYVRDLGNGNLIFTFVILA
jgi:hypothetical protein